jgi:hypothetical protein
MRLPVLGEGGGTPRSDPKIGELTHQQNGPV